MLDQAKDAVRSLSEKLSSMRLKNTIGGSARNKVAEHLTVMDAERSNKMGAPRSHFFADAARSTQYSIEADGVYVGIFKRGMRQRYEGGTIRPNNGKYLTLPACSEAYGKRARVFDDLEVLFGRRGPYALAQRAGTSISFVKDQRKGRKGKQRVKRGADRGGIFYWLVKSVTQHPDPTVLPTEEDLKAHIGQDLQKLLTVEGRG